MECNRDEWMLRVRRMGSCPCKQPGRPIARFHSNPSGKCLAGRCAALRRLLIAELSTAHRALHPIPARRLCDSKKTLNRLLVRKHYDSGNMPATQKDATGQGVVWLSINSTEKASSDYLEPAKLMAWKQERKAAPTAVLMDEEGTVGRSYGARTTSHLYIVNPQGKLIYAGGIDSIPSARPADIEKAANYVKVGLAEALSGKPISAAPYGCSIKYKSPA